MTRKEAIEIFKRLKENAPNEMHLETVGTAQELFDMAIQALSQEPQCTEQPCLGTLCRYYKEPCRVKNELNIELNELKPCDDVVSRQAVIYYIKGHIHEIITESGTDKNAHTNSILRALINGVETMPSVTPSCDKCAMNGSGSKYCDNCKQKSGKWIKVKSGDKDFPESIVCSRCNNENSHLDFNENAEPIGKVFVTSKYCPNCGACMKEGRTLDEFIEDSKESEVNNG